MGLDSTYIGGTEASVIDYAVANEKAREAIRKVKEGNRTVSDHSPIEVEIEIDWENTGRRQRKQSNIIEKKISVWTEERIEHYQKM